jgi:hypothetical protein
MNEIVKECEGCEIAIADKCPRYRDPRVFQRTTGLFMCPSWVDPAKKVETKKKVRVGQQKQSKFRR